MTDRVPSSASPHQSYVTQWIAKALYDYAGLTKKVFGHRIVRACMSYMPSRPTEKITRALCRTFALRAGIQPTRIELERLAFLYGVFPQDQNIFTLTFRVNLYPNTNDHAINHLLDRMTLEMDLRDDLSLMRLFYEHKTSSAGFDLQRFQRVDFDRINHDGVLVDIWRILFIKLVMEKLNVCKPFDKDGVRNYIEIEPDPNIIYTVLYIVFDRFNRLNDLSSLAAVVEKARFKTSVEGFAIAYFFLVSFGFNAQAEMLEKNHSDLPKAYLHPLYIKGKLSPQPLSAASPPPHRIAPINREYSALIWAWRDAELEKIEIGTRLALQDREFSPSTRDLPSKPYLLVALFGQMRFPEATLPGLRDWILNDFSTHAPEVDITFAVSTWHETGGKVFLPDDHIDTIGGFLSAEIIELLKSLGCCTISDVKVHCPRVASKILDQKQTKDLIDEREIALHFPGETYFDVRSEASYMRALGQVISDASDGNKMLMNQGRMIARIGSVGQILAKLDRSRSTPTHVLFIRPDLCNVSGSLASIFQQMRGRVNWSVVDQDAYAQVVEGVGDRFILADRSAANRISEIEAYTRQIFYDENPENKLRRKRLEPHQMLRSLLFEASVDVFTVSRHIVGWNLFRGAVNQETILAELRTDISLMADSSRKEAFLARL
ncbi:hypothetical protein JHFBIEKO_3123 [Methylobacterium mesophilicum]|uniref:hypothetical protein n=1 Tax=Methylobacterium mesophilicum TaxID=39956 RepID=UPI001EE161BC|nr:hypothetical protein [Methylobacterium mesophilicum]GJE22667.1 hypothetical protein JHFBIEKO_3123 [Methylobacterium mesophilicum]